MLSSAHEPPTTTESQDYLRVMGEDDVALIPYKMLLAWDASPKERLVLAVLYAWTSSETLIENRIGNTRTVPYEHCQKAAGSSKAAVTAAVNRWAQRGVIEVFPAKGYMLYRFLPGPHNWMTISCNK